MYRPADYENMVKGISPLLETRIFAYDLLRRTFLEEPTKEFLLLFAEEGLIEGFPFTEEDEKIREGVQQVIGFLKEYDSYREKKYDDLHWEYTRMFVGPYELSAPPWESAYLSKERLLFQEQTLKVRQAYLKYGFAPKNFKKEADDHLGLELDFMYQLSSQSLEALETQDGKRLFEILKDQESFLQEHLLKWVPGFSKDVIENSKYGFYRGMVKILNGYLELDLRALKELLDIDLPVS